VSLAMGTGARYQGARWRRAARAIMAIYLVPMFVAGTLQNGLGVTRPAELGWTALVVAALDWWFARRMGLTIASDGLILRYAVYRKRVPWSQVRGFEWRRWRRADTPMLWILTDDEPIRIPTVGRVAHGIPWFGSSDLRSRAGAEVDALETLQSALARTGDAGGREVQTRSPAPQAAG
jgi:hypothetical protein